MPRYPVGTNPWHVILRHAVGAQLGRYVEWFVTLRGAWDKVREDPVLKFLVLAVTAYGMSRLRLVPFYSLGKHCRTIDWTVGHVHNGALWVAASRLV